MAWFTHWSKTALLLYIISALLVYINCYPTPRKRKNKGKGKIVSENNKNVIDIII